jgi:hypothetical protein
MLLTIIESPLFSRLWPDYWSEGDRGEFAAFIANNPEAGTVIPGSGGCRKVRWARAGAGKRGGVRVIIHAKSARENIPAHVLRKIAEEMGHATS